jgi:hypothetical protein
MELPSRGGFFDLELMDVKLLRICLGKLNLAARSTNLDFCLSYLLHHVNCRCESLPQVPMIVKNLSNSVKLV